MADVEVGVISGPESVDELALLNTSMDAEDGPIGPSSNLIEMEEEMLLQEDSETTTATATADTSKPIETTKVEEEVTDISVKDEEKPPTTKSEPAKMEETCDKGAPETLNKPVAEEGEDDIICLDGDSGVSDSKRPRKSDDEDIMEIDENGISKLEKESVGKVIRHMSRKDLEDLVLAKIVEAIVVHTEVGQLRSKVLQLQMQKDKMANKMGVMMKQVAELSGAVNNIIDNESRDPKLRMTRPHAIRFNRSVGLQTLIEPSVRSAPPKIIRVPEAPQNGMKQYGTSYPPGSNSGTFATPQQPVKRVYQGKSGEKTQSNASPSPRKTYSASPTTPSRVHPIAPKPPSVPITPTPPPATQSQSVQPGVVDLTDDDPPSSTSASQNIQPTGATTIINGVQYQIVNRPATTSGGVQLVAPGGVSGQKYIVAPGSATQNRSVVLQQIGVGTAGQQQQQQQVVYRTNNSNVQGIPRPAGPRSNGNVPRVAASVPVRPPTGGGVLNATNVRRFVLPPLPPTPTPKAKNDYFKPPPKPELTLNEQADGIVLSWNLPTINTMAEVTTYQIFACQESMNTATARPVVWKRVGDVKALPLPMACTLSQFTEENRYYFIVRGIDVYGRTGPFCEPQNILLRRKK